MLKLGTGPDNSFTQDIATDLFQYDPVHKLVDVTGIEPVVNPALDITPRLFIPWKTRFPAGG
jgi:hypothetical protein